PDVSGIDPTKIRWVHRRSADREIYFISNQSDEPMAFSPTFNTSGRTAELWDAVSGNHYTTARTATVAGGLRVDLALGPRGSIFVVFPAGLSDRSPGILSVSCDGRADATTAIGLVNKQLTARVTKNGSYRISRSDGSEANLEVRDLPAPAALPPPWAVRF